MEVFLPVGEISSGFPLLVGVGAMAGFLSGFFGVSGGFLLASILMMIGIPPTVAAASDSCQIVAGSTWGAAAHLRLGNVDIKLGTVLLGGLAGGWLGVRVIKMLRPLGSADFAITITYVVTLGLIGSYVFAESLRNLRRGTLIPKSHLSTQGYSLLGLLPFQMDFPRSQVRRSVLVPSFLCDGRHSVGDHGGRRRLPRGSHEGVCLAHAHARGGGRGSVSDPVHPRGRHLHTGDRQSHRGHRASTAAGSAIGAQAGARVGRRLRGDQIRILLASVVLSVMAKTAVGLLLTPEIHLTPWKGHRVTLGLVFRVIGCQKI